MTGKHLKKAAPVHLPSQPFERGLVQVYTGNGKGKTTAAIGLAIRAVGQGLRVFIGQFMKGSTYGELSTLALIPNITLRQFGTGRWVIRGQAAPEDIEAAQKGFAEVEEAVFSGDYDVVVMDEINVATAWQLIPLEKVIELIRHKPAKVELVLTGRAAPPEIVDLADLVTEMMPIKHPADKGIFARKGIEF